MFRSCARFIAVVAVVLSSRSINAAAISYSFGSTLGATETAGAPGVNVAHWNAITSSSQTIATPVNSSGALTGASTTFTGNDFGITAGSGTNDAHLFTGFVDQSTSGPSTLVVSNVPYANYDVYIYMRNDTDGSNRTGEFTIDGSNRFARGPGSADPTFKDPSQVGGGYTLSPDTTQSTAAATTEGDYVEFTNLSDSTLTVDFAVGAGGDLQRNKFVGLEIVQITPEPSSVVALIGLCGMGLFLFARRRRKS
jgi:hypothetical protein